MGYSNTLPGIGEATIDALHALIVADLANLNAALATGGLTPITFVAGQVVVGDSQYLGASRISVCGGTEDDPFDLSAEPYMAPLRYRNQLVFNVFVYLHPDEMAATYATPELREAASERAQARVADHFRARLFNRTIVAGWTAAELKYALSVSSREQGGASDVVHEMRLARIEKGWTPKGYGDMILVPYVKLRLECEAVT